MPNPFSVSDLDALSTKHLLEKGAVYYRAIVALSPFKDEAIVGMVTEMSAALAEIEAEIERRRKHAASEESWKPTDRGVV